MTVKALSAPGAETFSEDDGERRSDIDMIIVPRIQSALTRFADPALPYEEQKEAMNAMFTRAYLQKLMAAANGNQSRAARIAKLDRTYLGRLLLKYGMRS